MQSLMRAGDADAKAVVWAHNSHIGNAAATAMGWQGEFNICDLRMIGRDSGLFWRLLIPVPQAGIGPSGNEESGSFCRTSLSCMVQWGKTRQICRIDISPGIKQG